jgi:hypothetical protein
MAPRPSSGNSNHLFWDPARHQWVQAARLRKGEPLKTPGGAKVYADGGTTPSNRDGWMWDLTIPGGRLTCKVLIR